MLTGAVLGRPAPVRLITRFGVLGRGEDAIDRSRDAFVFPLGFLVSGAIASGAERDPVGGATTVPALCRLATEHGSPHRHDPTHAAGVAGLACLAQLSLAPLSWHGHVPWHG